MLQVAIFPVINLHPRRSIASVTTLSGFAAHSRPPFPALGVHSAAEHLDATLQVRRPSGAESDIPVFRSAQPYRSPVTHQLVAERDGEVVGLVKLSAFNARTRAEVADALRDLEAEGAQRYVLDLRNNLGGLFLEGIEVARLFVDGGTRGPHPGRCLQQFNQPSLARNMEEKFG